MTAPETTASTPRNGDAPPWTRDQIDLIKRTCVPAGGLPTDDEFKVFLHVCRSAGLDPLLREAHLIERSAQAEGGAWIKTWQTMASRDGYLAVAHRHGDLRGLETTVYPEDASKAPTHATCKVYRAGWVAPVSVTVAFSEYIQRKRDNTPTKFWREKPRTMIGKVAQSQALRLAYSLHGTYTAEELPEDEPRQRIATPPLDAAPEAMPAWSEPPAARHINEDERTLLKTRSTARVKALKLDKDAANLLRSDFLGAFAIAETLALPAARMDEALAWIAAWEPISEPGSAG